ncbi:MAG: hypothetical protein DRO67_06635 [Candidatus Asgardarchaeum californiense]|nr:MAG: hypothetical protein DRO67_06635 [Candidatus Asgardarchaeum californiense]
MSKGVVPIGVRFKLRRLQCHKCGYRWYPRKEGKIHNCPSCRSFNWNRGKQVFIKLPVLECPKCKHKWSPYSTKVSECPKCKQRIYKLPEGK